MAPGAKHSSVEATIGQSGEGIAETEEVEGIVETKEVEGME